MTTAVKTFTALVVDDNYYNRDVAAIALKHVGYDVTEAVNGVQALDKLYAERYDLLVLDLMMDEMDGVEVLRVLKGRQSKHKMFVIVMTANPHMITEEVADAADLILQKPIEVQEFARLTRRLINS